MRIYVTLAHAGERLPLLRPALGSPRPTHGAGQRWLGYGARMPTLGYYPVLLDYRPVVDVFP